MPVLLSLAALSGCAGIISSAVYSVVKGQNVQLHDAQILSAQPPYKVTWVTKLGSANAHRSSKASIEMIASGHYRNWSWKVQGPSSVSASWQTWLVHGARVDSEKQGVILDWQHGFETLWKVTNYLLDAKPLPMQLTLTLVPNNHVYEAEVTQSNTDNVPVIFSAWYPTTKGISPSAAQKRFHFYAESLAVAGGLLERVELARGITAAPPDKAARKIKDRAKEALINYSYVVPAQAGTQ